MAQDIPASRQPLMTARLVKAAQAIPSAQPEPTATPAPTAQPQPTATPVPTAQPQPTATPVPTAQLEPTATPAPLAADLTTAREAYRAVLDDTNPKLDPILAQFDAAGNDVHKLAAALVASAIWTEDFVTSVKQIAFPSSVQGQVDDLIATNIARARACRRLAGNPTSKSLLDAYNATLAPERVAAAEMRRALGLPQYQAKAAKATPRPKSTPTPAGHRGDGGTVSSSVHLEGGVPRRGSCLSRCS